MIRFIIAAIFIVAGIFVFAAAAFGVFKFKYVLNRMHVAAKCDSLGALLILVGCMILGGFSFMTLKLLSDSMDNKSGCGSPDCKSRSKNTR